MGKNAEQLVLNNVFLLVLRSRCNFKSSGRLAPAQVFWYKSRLFGIVGPGPAATGVSTMARICMVTGKRPLVGNNVSHAQNKTKRRFLPNIQSHRFWVESEKRFVKLRVSTKGMRIIDKNGIDKVLADIRGRGFKI